MDQLRRTADWQIQEGLHPGTLVAHADPVGVSGLPDPGEPRAQPVAAGDPPVAKVSGLVSPALVLLATAAILEGYWLLNVIPTRGWRWSAIALVVLTIPLALGLCRPRRGGRRTPMQNLLAAGSTLLVALTALTLLVDRPAMVHVLGVYDLLFALTALGSVLVVERSTHHG